MSSNITMRRKRQASASASSSVKQDSLKVTRRSRPSGSGDEDGVGDAAGAGGVRTRRSKQSEEEGAGIASLQDTRTFDISMYSQQNEQRDTNMVVFFVIPKGKTEATCSPNLASAYVFANDSKMTCRWMKEAACLTHIPKYGNIFVMDPFEGAAYDRLILYKDKGHCAVMGPQVLRYLLQCTDDVVSDLSSSPFTLGMKNLLICISGVKDQSLKDELTRKVRLMYGEVTPSFTKGVTHVIAGYILSEKVLMAYQLNVPVMKTEWVEAVWEESQRTLVFANDPKFIGYVCPIFYNLNICVSQVQKDLKSALQKTIEKNGGIYSPVLLKQKVEMLVVPKPEGDKYLFASKWKLPCVTPDWVEACRTAGHVVRWKDFVVGREVLNKHDLKNLSVRASTPINSLLHIGPFNNETMLSNISGANGVHRPNESSIGDVSSPQHSDELTKKISAILKLSNQLNLGAFLDGCQIYISKAQKAEEVRKLVNASGAIRRDNLVENVTHIIPSMEQKLTYDELQTLKDLDPRPYVVKVDWLIESAEQKHPVAEDEFKVEVWKKQAKNGKSDWNDAYQNSSAVSRVADTIVDCSHVSALEIEDRDVAIMPASSRKRRIRGKAIETAVPVPAALVTADQEGKMQESKVRFNPEASVVEIPAEPFKRINFKVSSFTAEEQIELESIIRSAGGVISEEYQYIIVPCVYSRNLKTRQGCEIRTKFWVMDCVENNTLCELSDYYYKPCQEFIGMSKIFRGLVAYISQYGVSEKEYLAELVTAMGGMAQNVFARRETEVSGKIVSGTTHLICPKCDGDKYTAALKWGKSVVVGEWVLECFNMKRVLDVSPFSPKRHADSTSDSTCLIPVTPKHVSGGKVGSGSKIPRSNKPTDIPAQIKAPVTPKSSTPLAASTPNHPKYDFWADFEAHKNDPSFLDYMATHSPPNYNEHPSFLEWLANRTKSPEPDPADMSSLLLPQFGYTRAESRALKLALEMGLPRSRPPTPPFRIRRRNSTPPHEFMIRLAKQLNGYSSDKEQDASSNGNHAVRSPEAKNGKRPSNTSNDDSESNEDTDDVVFIKASQPQSSSKRLRLSTDNEGATSSRVTSPQVLPQLNISSKSDGSEHGNSVLQLREDKSNERDAVDAPRVSRTKSSNQILKNLLAEKELQNAPRKINRRLNTRNNINGGQDKPKADEIDEPHVVWDSDSPVVAFQSRSRPNSNAADISAQNESENYVVEPDVTARKSGEFISLPSPHSPSFMLSGLVEADKKGLRAKIERLAGRASQATCFEPEAFALVADILARSEKILCCIASGKPIVKSSYIHACENAGRFIEITSDFLWKDESEIARMSFAWFKRIRKNPKDLPFEGVRVFWNDAPSAKLPGFTRLLEAGGGKIVHNAPEATVLIAESAVHESFNVPVQRPNWIHNVLMSVLNP